MIETINRQGGRQLVRQVELHCQLSIYVRCTVDTYLKPSRTGLLLDTLTHAYILQLDPCPPKMLPLALFPLKPHMRIQTMYVGQLV